MILRISSSPFVSHRYLFVAVRRSFSAWRFWDIITNGAAYAAWNDNARFKRMKGYGSHPFIQAREFTTSQHSKMMLCVMIKGQLPTVEATLSAIFCPIVNCSPPVLFTSTLVL